MEKFFRKQFLNQKILIILDQIKFSQDIPTLKIILYIFLTEFNGKMFHFINILSWLLETLLYFIISSHNIRTKEKRKEIMRQNVFLLNTKRFPSLRSFHSMSLKLIYLRSSKFKSFELQVVSKSSKLYKSCRNWLKSNLFKSQKRHISTLKLLIKSRIQNLNWDQKNIFQRGRISSFQ